MPVTMGSLFAREPKHKQRAYSALVSIGEELDLRLVYNDRPAIVMHRRGNGPWQYIVINNAFHSDMIPRNSDIQLSAILEGSEKIIYRISY